MIQPDGQGEARQRWARALESGSFEDVLDSLEEVLSHLETGRLSLADGLDYYEIGTRLTKRGEEILAAAELRISQLTLTDEPGSEDVLEVAADDEGPDGPAF